jgi:hypothetical protein
MLYDGLPDATMDAGGRVRMSQITSLFDGKTLNSDNLNLWHTVGTGTNSFANNKNTLTVTSGQWEVRQSNLTLPYFSGKSQLVEITFDNFQSESGVTKRCGYFSSSATSPYDTIYDGFFLESSSTEVNLVIYNSGTLIAKIPHTSWSGYTELSAYDWSKFTVAMFDFLWLGGTELTLYLKVPNKGFVLAHSYQHAGVNTGTFIKSPNQPIRHEIRSTIGSGSLTVVCSQVSSEGSNNESGESYSIMNPAFIATNVVGTVYALKGIKKQTAFRDVAVQISNIGTVNSSTADAGTLMLLKNPTLSAPLTYSNISRIQQADATTQTVTALGDVIFSIPVAGSAESQTIATNYSTWLQNRIDNTMNEYVLAYRALTANQSVAGHVNLKLF